jgi:hypothetical protein
MIKRTLPPRREHKMIRVEIGNLAPSPARLSLLKLQKEYSASSIHF